MGLGKLTTNASAMLPGVLTSLHLPPHTYHSSEDAGVSVRQSPQLVIGVHPIPRVVGTCISQ